MAESEFRRALMRSESSGDYDAVNSEGYVGAYQFGPDRLADFSKAFGRDVSMEEFQNSPELQDQVQSWHEQDVLQYAMDNNLDYYIGKEVGGVKVTPSSLIGMAHIGGKSGMRQFIESGGEYNPADKYGTTISDYGQKFSDMNIYDVNPSGRSPIPRPRPEGIGSLYEDKEARKARGVMSALGYMQAAVTPDIPTPPSAPISQLQRGRRVDPMARFGGIGGLRDAL
jgi:hypothetical protein